MQMLSILHPVVKPPANSINLYLIQLHLDMRADLDLKAELILLYHMQCQGGGYRNNEVMHILTSITH